MEVPSYLLAGALLMVVAQRLVRRTCPDCSAPYVPTDEDRREFRMQLLWDAGLKKALSGQTTLAEVRRVLLASADAGWLELARTGSPR